MKQTIAKSAKIGRQVKLGQNVVIEEQVRVGANTRIGHNVIIQKKASIGANCEIGHNVVVYPGTSVGSKVLVADNTVLGRQVRSGATSTRTVKETLPPLTVGDSAIIGAGVVLYAGTDIGKHVLVADMASVRELCKIEDYAIVGRGVLVEYETSVGRYTKIQTGCYITGNMIIEDHVFFGPEVSTANDKYMDRTDDPFAGPHVKRGARIGSNSMLLPGIVIGKDAVVGAGSVVTRDVADYTVVVGNPARAVKQVPKNQRMDRV